MADGYGTQDGRRPRVGVLKEAIEKLTRLQALDSQIRKLRSELEEKPRLMGAEKKQLDDARAALADAERRPLSPPVLQIQEAL